MARNKKAPRTIEAAAVTSYKHKDKRAHIPTQEESVKLSHREKQPVKKKYDYDPSLDPQLIWSGKKESGDEFAVSTVPIYVQEKVSPEALIARLKQGSIDEAQYTLFGETTQQQFDKAVEFYKHEDNWQNRMILGDSLLVMNSLLEKEGMRGKVQSIYIDPPYGIKFGSNWQSSTRKRDVKDNKVEDLVRQPEQVKAFRDTWELGIHSYLSYLRDRLIVSRELLTSSGSCFVQINDENVHHVRELMDEIFGSNNFVKLITFQKTSGQETKTLASTIDFLVWYAKDIDQIKYRQLYQFREVGEKSLDRYDMLMLPNGETRRMNKEEIETGNIPPNSKRYQLAALFSEGGSASDQSFEFQGKVYKPRAGTHWKTTLKGLKSVMPPLKQGKIKLEPAAVL